MNAKTDLEILRTVAPNAIITEPDLQGDRLLVGAASGHVVFTAGQDGVGRSASAAVPANRVKAVAAAALDTVPEHVAVLPERPVRRSNFDGSIVRVGDEGAVVATADVTIETMRAQVEMSELALATRRAVLALLEAEASR